MKEGKRRTELSSQLRPFQLHPHRRLLPFGSNMSAAAPSSLKVLVYGGAGALGRAVVAAFKVYGACVDSVDFSANSEATHNFIVDSKFEESLTKVVKEIESLNSQAVGTKSCFKVVLHLAEPFSRSPLTLLLCFDVPCVRIGLCD